MRSASRPTRAPLSLDQRSAAVLTSPRVTKATRCPPRRTLVTRCVMSRPSRERSWKLTTSPTAMVPGATARVMTRSPVSTAGAMLALWTTSGRYPATYSRPSVSSQADSSATATRMARGRRLVSPGEGARAGISGVPRFPREGLVGGLALRVDVVLQRDLQLVDVRLAGGPGLRGARQRIDGPGREVV